MRRDKAILKRKDWNALTKRESSFGGRFRRAPA
jgi:hypothetical protein